MIATNVHRPHQAYPLLTSRVKAAETRHLTPIVENIYRDLCNVALPEDRDILAVLSCLVGIYEVLDITTHVLPEAHSRIRLANNNRFYVSVAQVSISLSKHKS